MLGDRPPQSSFPALTGNFRSILGGLCFCLKPHFSHHRQFYLSLHLPEEDTSTGTDPSTIFLLYTVLTLNPHGSLLWGEESPLSPQNPADVLLADAAQWSME